MQEDYQSLLKHIRELEYKKSQLCNRQDDINNQLIYLSTRQKDKLELFHKIFNARRYYISTKKRENDIIILKEAKEEIAFSIDKLDLEIQNYLKLAKDLNANEMDNSKTNFI